MLRLSQETMAVIGTAVAVATFVAYQSFTIEDRIYQRLETLENHMDQRFEAVDQRFEGVDQRFEGVDQRLNALERKIDDVNGRIIGQAPILNAQERRIARIEGFLFHHSTFPGMADPPPAPSQPREPAPAAEPATEGE